MARASFDRKPVLSMKAATLPTADYDAQLADHGTSCRFFIASQSR